MVIITPVNPTMTLRSVFESTREEFNTKEFFIVNEVNKQASIVGLFFDESDILRIVVDYSGARKEFCGMAPYLKSDGSFDLFYGEKEGPISKRFKKFSGEISTVTIPMRPLRFYNIDSYTGSRLCRLMYNLTESLTNLTIGIIRNPCGKLGKFLAKNPDVLEGFTTPKFACLPYLRTAGSLQDLPDYIFTLSVSEFYFTHEVVTEVIEVQKRAVQRNRAFRDGLIAFGVSIGMSIFTNAVFDKALNKELLTEDTKFCQIFNCMIFALMSSSFALRGYFLRDKILKANVYATILVLMDERKNSLRATTFEELRARAVLPSYEEATHNQSSERRAQSLEVIHEGIEEGIEMT